jgi:hypothetical protein
MKKHLLEAAERGNAEAQFNLAMMCENGLADNTYTNEDSHSEALRWLLAAATQGLPRAQIKLAELYAVEAETPEDAVKACGWFLVATGNSEGIRREQAQAAYRRLSDRLTPAQSAEAARFAEDWKPQNPALATAGPGLSRSGTGAGA